VQIPYGESKPLEELVQVQVNTRSSSRDYAASTILSLVLLLLLFGDRISKIGVPWGASDMTMYYNLVRYWNFWGFSRAEDMAFPLGADPNLFSGDAVISYAFGSLVYAMSGNPFAGINLLFLLSFPVVSVLALACIRSVGLKGPWAIVLSVSFSFIPFHIWRGLEHIHLSLLFGATAGMLIVLLVMKGTWKEWTEGKPTATSLWRIIGVGALVLIAAWTSLTSLSFRAFFCSQPSSGDGREVTVPPLFFEPLPYPWQRFPPSHSRCCLRSWLDSKRPEELLLQLANPSNQ